MRWNVYQQSYVSLNDITFMATGFGFAHAQVCDSSFSLMKTGFALRPLAPENALIGSPVGLAHVYLSAFPGCTLPQSVRTSMSLLLYVPVCLSLG